MSNDNAGAPFQITDSGEWIYLIRFPEFKSYNAAALKEAGSPHDVRDNPAAKTSPGGGTLVPISRPHEEDDDDEEEIDDDEEAVNELNRLFELGLFEVSAEPSANNSPPTPAQIRTCEALIRRTSAVYRILIEHLYQYYNENRDGFRDFFNGDPDDRDLLFPNLRSPDDLKSLIRLMLIEIHERTRDGQCLVTFSFDTTWNHEEYHDVTLCGDRVVSFDSAPFPFAVPKVLDWQKCRPSKQGSRFVEFLYRDSWTGTFTINTQGICDRQIPCPVCDGLELEDPELITGIRDATASHMLSTLVYKLRLGKWTRRGLGIVGPVSFILGWSWNPLFYWVTLSVSLISAIVIYLNDGWRWSGWITLAVLEAGIAGYALLPQRGTPTLDAGPSWTWFGLFEYFVWWTSAAIAAVWMFLLLGMSRHPILRRVIWYLASFAVIQISALIFVAVTDYSALHLLWTTPLALIAVLVIATRAAFQSIKDSSVQLSVGKAPIGGGQEDAWGQLLEKLKRANRSNTVYESKPRPKQNPGETDN